MSDKETVYGGFIDYYGDIPLKLLKFVEDYAVYACRVHSGLNALRYIFVIVPKPTFPKQQVTLNDLDWVSFQTRTTEEQHNVPVNHVYPTPEKKEHLKDVLNVLDRTGTQTNYVTNTLPIKVTLMHDPRKKNYLQYPDQARLYQALETYNCVVEML